MGSSLPGAPSATSTTDAASLARPSEAAPRPLATWVLLVLLLWLGVLLLSPTLGPDPDAYLAGDPLHYAAIAKSTLRSDDWLMLKLGDKPYFNKPPLMFWAAMASYRIFGISTWSAEVPGILAGLGVMLGTFLLGAKLLDRRHGFVAAVVLATTYVFLRNASVLRMDAPVTLGILISMGALLVGETRRAFLPLFFTGVTLGVLVKGPAGLFPIPILLVWRLLRARPMPLLRDPLFWSSALLLPLLLLPWLLHVYGLHGEHFVEAYTADVDKIVNHAKRTSVVSKYATDLIREGWPWLPFFVHGLWLGVRAVWRHERADAWTLPVAWILTVAVVLMLLSRAYSRYVIPMLPATSLLTARSLLGFWPRLVGRRLAVGMALLLAVATVLLAARVFDITGDRQPDIARFQAAFAADGQHERVQVVDKDVSDSLQSAAILYCDLQVDALPPDDLAGRLPPDGRPLLALVPHGAALPEGVDAAVRQSGEEFDLVSLTAPR